MIKNYKQITYRYLKVQKKRTILTIIGIILSVALITAIGTMVVSIRDAAIKNVIKRTGDYHVVFTDVPSDKIDKITKNVEVEKSGITKANGYAPLRETTEEERREDMPIPYKYLSIRGYDKESLDILPYKVKEGRFPVSSDEIVLEKLLLEYFPKKPKVGDRIVLSLGKRMLKEEDGRETAESQYLNGGFSFSDLGERFEKEEEKEYTVVGIMESDNVWHESYIYDTIVGLDKKDLKDNNYDIYVRFSSVNKARDKAEKIAKNIGLSEENIQYNDDLLELSAQSPSKALNNALVQILIFIIALVIVATVAVIYNSFNISVLERISQFGLLRSVGSTPKQIRDMVFKEATLLSAIGIPIGLFCGVLAMKIVLYIISLIKFDFVADFEIVISPIVFLISSILGLVTVYLSAYGPAKKAGKISPLDAVRNTGGFKKETFKKVKSSKLIRKLFGMEGELAYKNLRRNRKRFVITVFSMVISIVLFISFSSFSNYIFSIGAVSDDEVGNFFIYSPGDLDLNSISKELKNMEDVKRVYKSSIGFVDALVEDDAISPKLKELNEGYYDEKRQGSTVVSNSNIMTFGNDNMDALKPYLKDGTIDVEKLNSENGVLVVTTIPGYNEKTNKGAIIEGFNFKIGDKILIWENLGDAPDGNLKEVKVMGILERGLLSNEFKYNLNGGLNIVSTEEMYDKLKDTDLDSQIYIEMEREGNNGPVREYLAELEEKDSNFHYVDYSEQAEEERKVNIIMNIFLYGFVAVIALISCVNIINTISTNLILRTRELAMIKAVGMAQKSVKKMVALESIYYGLIATIYGGIIGTGLSYVLYKIVMEIREFEWMIPWNSILISSIGAIAVALISAYIPLKRINNGNIIDKIKMEE
ncbi:ABC transporter permease [Anaerosalibacter bizertensis]|uniref:ABC transporter permease n=1 Tax=Anaerosalibacter bizertensis TaxID=932217 RepID=A0A9Q4AD51_9FIRM|nr:ABC transporter permease [Anaerosalibacter bizertensis]MBV1819175.1 ABC transporter permease [Bacteroidales bacterium MSK.15.36]MCB5559940.1 ABC transporter permease [Anaerosalibacter bizertensis]MCG4565471.1 ABC transporter permease [Anaerosalibacter bizertensis]MCG4583304.1 ABC transporter permease [Anaerosalibacter bizertensis]